MTTKMYNVLTITGIGTILFFFACITVYVMVA